MIGRTTLFFTLLFIPFLGSATPSQSDANGENDTINQVDENGLKQGYWVIDGSMKNIPEFGPDQVIEEGHYKDSRKTGLWKKYFPNGNLKSKITYQRSRPKGPYTLYYRNGNIEEKGVWDYNKNVGDFKRYHKNGNIAQDFHFNEDGKSDGVQKYYHENGKLEVKVEKENGKEDGLMERYYANGELKERKKFDDGKVKEGTVQEFERSGPEKDEEQQEEQPSKEALVEKDEKTRTGEKDQRIEEGYHTLYNEDNQVTKTGYFKNGKLWKGKWRKYDEDGILRRIEIYRKGQYIGDGVLPDEE